MDMLFFFFEWAKQTLMKGEKNTKFEINPQKNYQKREKNSKNSKMILFIIGIGP